MRLNSYRVETVLPFALLPAHRNNNGRRAVSGDFIYFPKAGVVLVLWSQEQKENYCIDCKSDQVQRKIINWVL